MLKKSYTSIIICLLAVMLLLPSQSNAHRLGYFWEDYHVVGYGYMTNNNFVKAIQMNLKLLGQDSTVGAVDGVFGAKTERGVRNFQSAERIAVDGIAGRQTWREMRYYRDFVRGNSCSAIYTINSSYKTTWTPNWHESKSSCGGVLGWNGDILRSGTSPSYYSTGIVDH